MPSAGAREREWQQRPPIAQSREGQDAYLEATERIRSEYHVMLTTVLAKKDEQLARKDELLAKQGEQLVAALAKKDEQLAVVLTQHREDLRKKDEQLERLTQQLSGVYVAHTSVAPFQQPQQHTQQHTQPHTVSVPPAAPPAQPPAPSPHQGRRVQPSLTIPAEAPPASVVFAPSSISNLVAQMQTGGDEAEAALISILESALETIEAVLISTPRKQRKAVKAQCERVEAILEEMNGETVGRIASCKMAELTVLSEKLSAIQTLQTAGDAGTQSVGIMQEALDELEKCGDVVAGSSRQLASVEPYVRRLGLQALTGMQRVVLGEAAAAEVEVASVVLEMAMDEGRADGERATALMGVFILGLRNAEATMGVLVKFEVETIGQIVTEVHEGRVQGREGAAMYV
eukprot:COSAG05_NODE_887_length_6737_cov_25.085719_6_plen_401_part_01